MDLILEYDRTEYMLTMPTVTAVLVGSPYSDTPSGTTSWGKSKSQGQGSETSTSHTAKVIMGFEFEQSVPIIGTKAFGIDFEASIGAEISSSFSRDSVVTKGETLETNEGTNAVVMTTSPYDLLCRRPQQMPVFPVIFVAIGG